MFALVLATLVSAAASVTVAVESPPPAAAATPGPVSNSTARPRPTASPKPDITAPPDFAVGPSWIPQPVQNIQYAAFVRPNSGAPSDLLTATKRKCDCDPADFVSKLDGALKQYNATEKSTTVQVCGQSAQHVLVEDLADGIGRRNIDAYVFREGDYFYTIQLGFIAKEPAPADEASLAALCPPAA